ncbi:sugar ABC transporter substrate-binding protein [Paenibacillus antri]|uniref:sugar ABC transporter substrate-binding protein n=1 Tax=Paenibacillus antri TaxID=2582848 RepID=UPI0026A388BD
MNRSRVRGGTAWLALLLLASACLFVSCEENGDGGAASEPAPTAERPTDGESPPADGPVKIGFSMDTLLEERWRKDRDLFKAAAEALGAEVDILAADGDDALQIAQAETLISRGVDLLVIVPHNAEAMATIVQKAHAADVKVLAYDRLVRNANVDMYVSFDNVRVGELQAEAITKLAPRGNYAYIGGAETDNNARLLKQGVFNVLQPRIDSGDIRIVYDQWTENWEPANAFENMQAALEANGNAIDAVIAANDATADAVIEALATRGLAGKVPVAGQDADLTAAQHIVEGTQTMTVYKPIQSLAQAAAELAVKLASGAAVTANRSIPNGKADVPALLLAPIAVDRATIDDTIIADGFHSREDVYKNVKE